MIWNLLMNGHEKVEGKAGEVTGVTVPVALFWCPGACGHVNTEIPKHKEEYTVVLLELALEIGNPVLQFTNRVTWWK